MLIYNFEEFNFQSFKASHSTCSRLHQTITKFIKRSCNFRDIFENLFAQETYFSTFRYYRASPCNNMTCSRINIFRVLASSRVRGTSFDIKIKNKFIEIKYSAPNRFIIFVTNGWYFTVLEIIWYGRLYRFISKMLGKSIKSIPLLIKGISIKCHMINFGINDWTKSMLSVTPCK